MLIDAFELYFRAASEPCAKTRAEQVLLANLLVGYHEQTRLQNPIAGAMGAPWNTLSDMRPTTVIGAALERVVAGLDSWINGLQRGTRQLFTRAFMSLELPDATVGLGRDMPPISPHHDFPPELRHLRLPRLLALLEKLDRTPNTVVGSGADDWASLDDRMNFVVDFFRSRQQDGRLFRCPLTPKQRALVSSMY